MIVASKLLSSISCVKPRTFPVFSGLLNATHQHSVLARSGLHTLRGTAIKPQLLNGIVKLQATSSRASAWSVQKLLTANKGFRSGKVLREVKRWWCTEVKHWRVTAETLSPQAQKAVGWWLVACCAAVFGQMTLGAMTRVTRSGLSMTSWHLIKGMKPPRSEGEWLAEFERYKQFPEYEQRQDLELSEFKRIFYMEWVHRMWGRAIAAIFLLPAAYFWRQGWFTRAMKPRVTAFMALLGFQGLLGWYMVRSGLERQGEDSEGSEIRGSDIVRVSQYRLAAHLAMALVLYTLMLWSGLSHLLPPHTNFDITAGKVRLLRRLAHPAKALVFFTAVSGAFVAGLDAGLVYNSFPKMADQWIPTDLFALSPAWRNWFENATTTQFTHRILGTTSVTLILLLWLISRGAVLPARCRLAVNTLTVTALLQVTLGVTTLLTYVPPALAVSHQAGALLTTSSAVWLTHELRRIPK